MQEGIKSLQRQAVSQLGLGTTTAPPNSSNSNAPTTFRSAPKPDTSFSSSKYFSQRDDFEHVDQSINLMDSTMDMMEQNSKSANRRRGKRPTKDLSKRKLNQDLSQRKLNQNLSQRNVLSAILTMDNSSNRNNTNHSNGANRKWWFPNWFARRGSNLRGSTNEVVLPSPPPPPSNLGNNSQNYPSSTSSSSSPSAFRNTLFTVCIVCQATCYSRRRLLLIVLLVMAMAATMIHVSILAHRMVQHNRLEDKLSSLDREGEMVEILVRKNITSPQALSDETQPASMALQWLVEQDPAHLATRHELLHDLVPRFVLTTLYFATTTTNKKKNQKKKKWTHETHWLTGKHVCEWHGITCTTKGGQRSNSILTQMNLTNNQLQGRLPLELNALSDMRILDLSYNAIQGPIWEDWTMGWTQLRSFRFQHNQGTGALPQRWNMPHLQELVLLRNKFRGTVPSFGQHHMLKVLYLQDNKFSGSLPSKSMASWTKMRFLHLHNNQLGGSIPDTIGGMTLLEELSLQGNDLVGAIPASISSLSGLEMLRLGDNALTGSIPEVFGNLVKLTDLQLSSNRFRSLLPTSIGGLPKLKWFAIDASGMTGYIPKEWKGMTNLEVLLLHENDLVSSLDGELLRALNKLRQLSLHTNFFRGSLPSEVGLLSDLKELLLQTNDLRGPLPSEIGNLQKLGKPSF
ncbi:LRR receptor-like serine threonine-protein kinase At4g08850-like [Seminavis robusta]|uniref:LRR receptor-like serine threonine-protein kinase At4g08850-like n=1 Tax=Seminavis robusta TaxID=568900 RepID=A0A9N8EKM7_9STRA|nr:LRR receptor-like serine threonine-protein kinase At4g08850-like [Seminavis robusta]|eukprot:Sro1139_g245400.1 LRR receptor-like serine threonine-protein kinase At4g08850-like (684) ;mRNA; f:1800-4384